MAGERKTDSWFYLWMPKIIEAVIVIAMIYGGIKVTLSGLCADVDNLKCESKSQGLKLKELEISVPIELRNIKEQLDRMERKMK